MHRGIRVVLTLSLLALAASVPAYALGEAAIAKIQLVDGTEAGTISLSETNAGILIKFELQGLPPGPHAIHVHEAGKCEADFASAGAIHNPLAESVRIHTGRSVHTIERLDKGWHVWFDDQTSVGPFNAVAVCVPAPKARLLLGRLDDLTQSMSRVRMSPCWSLMVRLDERVLPDQDVFSDMSEVIRWIARNNTKPGRNSRGESVVIHASPSWSRETEDADPEVVAEELWNEISHVLALPPVRPTRMTAHLWRHGLVDTSLGETYLYSSEHRVGVAGDWCLGRLAEHAFESGDRLAKAIINSLS